MRVARYTLLSLLVVAMVALASRIDLRAADDDVQQMKDRAEIEALMWRYARALDSRDPEGYAAAFTPDGEFVSGGAPTKGAEALRKMVGDMKSRADESVKKGESPAAMHHIIANHTIEFTGKDQARYLAYWMTVFGPAGEGGQPRVAAVGRSIDQLVRVNGKWLIKSRNVRPNTN